MAIQANQPRADFLIAKENGNWHTYSTQDVHTMIYQLAIALMDLGISAGDGTNEGRDRPYWQWPP